MYFSKEQRKIIKKIKKEKIQTLSDFYQTELKKYTLDKLDLSDYSVFINNKKVRAKQGLPISKFKENNIQLQIKIKEFTELFEYLENERFIYSSKTEDSRIIWLCEEGGKVWIEILPLISGIYDKYIIKSSRINDFKGITVDEQIQRFKRLATFLALGIALITPIFSYWLNNYKPLFSPQDEIEYINSVSLPDPSLEQPYNNQALTESIVDSSEVLK